ASFGKESIDIIGRAESADFDHYVIEWGIGQNPVVWNTSGVVLENGGLNQVASGKLASIDFSSADFVDYITIRLTVFDTSSNLSVSTSVVHVDSTIQWKNSFANGLKGLALGDANNDGFDEIFMAEREGNKVHALDRNGVNLAGWPVQNVNFRPDFISLGNLTNDGNLEVVGSVYNINSNSSEIYAWRNNGDTVLGWPKILNHANYELAWLPPSLADIDKDNLQDTIQSTFYWFMIGGKGHVWNTNGEYITNWPIDFPGSIQTQGIADVNNNGNLELLFGTGDADKKLYILNADGS
ncbi:unnamed protein product, partial [marine sediment metagenome]